MSRKSLILYASMTGNTEKVAMSFKKAFEKKGWECDAFKIDKNTDVNNPPYDWEKYDFLCVGSPVILGQPVEEILKLMFNSPISAHQGQPTREDRARESVLSNDPNYVPQPRRRPKGARPVGKIIPGPKKGVVFVSYAGVHLGPKEAEPALGTLENELEHLKYECIGKFACPGKHGNDPGKDWWHGDMRQRPNERDLLKAEIFMEEKIEECRE